MSEWLEYFGRWHVALIHFPIGLLITAALVETIAVCRRIKTPTVTAAIMTFAGTFGAVVAVGLGWILAAHSKHPGSEKIVELHRWAGVITAGLATAAAFSAYAAIRGCTIFNWPFRVLIVAAAIAVVITGHWGGELIYGEDYYALPGSAPAAEVNE